MKLDNITKDNYDSFINYLFSLQDLKYKEFEEKIIDANIIGIRMPLLKKIAKEISKNNYQEFMKLNKNNYHEETMINGLIIGYLKDFNEVKNYLDIFVPNINNWAINDSVCANLKIFKKNKEDGFKLINKYIKTNKVYHIRMGLVLLLNYYIEEEYIDQILDICNSIKNTDYYVEMANAWLLSMCYIKYKDKTYNFLLDNNLDKFTFNKTISKICDSYKVDKNEKMKLKKLKMS